MLEMAVKVAKISLDNSKNIFYDFAYSCLKMKIILANPRGFCAGVRRAIEIVERAIEKFGTPLFVKHEIVHNRYVVESFKARGVVFTDDLSIIPNDATIV